MKFIELFSGIGGFRLGLERAGNGGFASQDTVSQERCENVRDTGQGHNEATGSMRHSGQSPEVGFRCVWANDNDKYACQIYRKHWGDRELIEADIRTVDVDVISEHDLLCAGFPCQSFSIAGKRGGFEDTRGTLFFEICRVLRAKRPGYLFLENVKGLLSHDDGNTFQTIIRTLDELGYDCQWQVLNSKNFGVPQNRERVFIIGHLRGQPRPKVFPIRENIEGINEGADESPSVRTLQGGGHSGGHHSGMTLIHTAYPESDGQKKGTILYKSNFVGDYIEQDYAGSLRSNYHEQLVNGIRRLTPLECERLQGFPDGWTEGVSDTQRYKCLGNAVTVNVIEAIGNNLTP